MRFPDGMNVRAGLILLLCFSIAAGFAQDDPNRSLTLGSSVVSVQLKNETGSPLSLRWINFEGGSEDYGSLAAAETVTLETYPGHLWTLIQGNRVLLRYRASASRNQSLTVGASSGDSPTPQMTGSPSSPPAQPQAAKPGNAPPNLSSPQNTGSRFSPQEATEMVDFHNRVRAEVGVGPVSWSPKMAAFAQAWADELADRGKFEHRPREQNPYGENLAAGSSPDYRPIEGAGQWYAEKKLFRAPNGVFTMALMPAGHYTQMVWRESTEIGAGKAVIRKGRMKGWTVIVCNYNPPGNRIGGKVY